MKVTVTRLRERGKRRHNVESDPGTVGDISLAIVGPVTELKLAEAGDQQMKPLIPVLYDAQLVTMHGDGMLFRGFE